MLQYLTHRSMKIALLPTKVNCAQVDETDGDRMESLKRQLKTEVIFDVLLKDGTMSADQVLDRALKELELDAHLVLLVSDKDEYLKPAKDKGMVTCRLRPMNAPRGNVSSHYMVESIPAIRDVVNEINGISFNAVMKGR